MLLYSPTHDGYICFQGREIKAKCPICGRLYAFDFADYILAEAPWTAGQRLTLCAQVVS